MKCFGVDKNATSVSLNDEGKLSNDTSKLCTEAVPVNSINTVKGERKCKEEELSASINHHHNHVLLFILLRVFDLWSLHLHCILHLASPKNPLESVMWSLRCLSRRFVDPQRSWSTPFGEIPLYFQFSP